MMWFIAKSEVRRGGTELLRSKSSASAYSFLDCSRDRVSKRVDLIESRIHVGSNSNSVELRMQNRSVDDSVIRHQPVAELRNIETVDAEQPNRTRCLSLERSQNLHPRTLRQ